MKLTGRAVFFMLLPLIAVVTGCSTSRNNFVSRSYQSLVTRYNVYFNGNEAYKKGYKAKKKALERCNSKAHMVNERVVEFLL